MSTVEGGNHPAMAQGTADAIGDDDFLVAVLARPPDPLPTPCPLTQLIKLSGVGYGGLQNRDGKRKKLFLDLLARELRGE